MIWLPVPHLNGSGQGETPSERPAVVFALELVPPIALQVQFNDHYQNREFTLPGMDYQGWCGVCLVSANG